MCRDFLQIYRIEMLLTEFKYWMLGERVILANICVLTDFVCCGNDLLKQGSRNNSIYTSLF